MIRYRVIECDCCGEEIGREKYKILKVKDLCNFIDEPALTLSTKFILCGHCEYKINRIVKLMRNRNKEK